MGRKRRKQNKSNANNGTVVNNFDKLDVNVEIDYDKLATAIVKAQCQAEQQQDESIKNVVKLHRKGLKTLYSLLSFVLITVAILFVLGLIAYIPTANWTTFENVVYNVYVVLISACLVAALVIVFSLLSKSSKEVSEIHDRNLLVSLSSSVVGFLALLIAVLALILN